MLQYLCILFFLCSCYVSVPCDNYQGACRCTPSSCDTVEPLGELGLGQFVFYETSSSDGPKFQRNGPFPFSKSPNDGWTHFSVNISQKYQTIVGFGGAFTDSASINIAGLNPISQKQIIEAYYGDDGIQYTLGRIPMASCDFSTYTYSYDEVKNDFDLNNFTIEMDFKYKIPLIRNALQTSSRNIHLFATPWSAPAWMKTNGERTGGGQLIGPGGGPYYKTWAKYFTKFIDAYKAADINIWGVTAQNEPGATVSWECMFFNATGELEWIKSSLGPELRKSHPEVKIMMLDDQRNNLPSWATTILSDPEANKYVDGIAVHWYASIYDIFDYFPRLSETNALYPSKFILATEACNGFLPPFNYPIIGDWGRGEYYAYDIIGDLNNFAVGWTDWNIVLDMQGGPNHLQNFVDAPIIADTKNGSVFYKQPMYYVMGHFSKFIVSGSVRIGLKTEGILPLDATAFLTPDGLVVVVVLNRDSIFSRSYYIEDEALGYINMHINPSSIHTLIYRSNK